MSIELKQAAQQVLDVFEAFGEADDFATLFTLTQKMNTLRTAIQQAESEPVGEPRARVELMKTGGNAGLSTRIIELDIATRERLRPGDLLYTHPAPGVPDAAIDSAIYNQCPDFDDWHEGPSIDDIRAIVRTAIQQAEAQQPATPEPVGYLYDFKYDDEIARDWFTQNIDEIQFRPATCLNIRPLYAHPAPGVPDGWSIEEKCGDLIVRKNGFGGYSARKNTESIAEAVLHELALDLLAAPPAQKGSS